MGKTVLITGASGFIGRHTALALRGAGWRVVRGGRSEQVGNDSEGVVYLNLKDPGQTLLLEKTLHCNAIVHLAARVGLSEEMDADLFMPNVLATGCIAHLATAWDAQLIFTSSVMVHGSQCENIQSGFSITPDTAYGRSKVLAEQLLAASGARHCVLRLAGVFGHDGPTHLGLNRAITGALHGSLPTQIGTGKALRNYVYVKDVARTIVHALDNDLTGIHLLAGHEVLSISQMLQLICGQFLPGQHPLVKDGQESTDQVVAPSVYLPKNMTFCEALADIKKRMEP